MAREYNLTQPQGELGEEARQDERRAQMAREYNLTQPHGELGEEARQDERRAQIAREYYLTQPHGEIGEEARQRPNSPSPDAQPVLKEQQQSQLKMSPSQRRMMRQLDEPMLGDEKAKGKYFRVLIKTLRW